MNTYSKMPRKHLYIILFTVASVILFASIEVMIKVKDLTLYETWAKSTMGITESSFNIYVTTQLSSYFTKIIIPMIFGVYTYFAYIKIRVNSLFVFMWSVLIIGSFGYNISDLNYGSIFFYGYIIGYFVLLMTVLSLLQIIQDSKSK
ncbi:MAG: hypothetical protein SCL54_07075 [Bacillota bacterium]|nr:hypothetical protein [Bacillota bacterium]